MGRIRTEKASTTKSQTLPSSPSHSFSSSSSSSDFEFTVSLSPRTKSSTINLYCPADELFYKGQLLPLHLSPRLSMVRTLLASSSTSSSSDTTSVSRDSSGSSTDSRSSFTSADFALLPHAADCDSSRPSSVAEDDEFKRFNNIFPCPSSHLNHQIKKNKYFSLSRFSSVFRKEPKSTAKEAETAPNSSVKRMSSCAKDVIRKYMKKVKPLYDKMSQKQQQKMGGISTNAVAFCVFPLSSKTQSTAKQRETSSLQSTMKDSRNNNGGSSHSFSGNLRYPRRGSCVASCPSSMRSSPSHSGALSKNGFTTSPTCKIGGGVGYNKNSSMEDLQSAIQGAIAHCKNSMLIQNKTMAYYSNDT